MKKAYYAGGILLGIVSAIYLLLALLPDKQTVSGAESRIAAELSLGSDFTGIEKTGNRIAAVETETSETYVSPVDFDALWDINEDIYAWLYIPGTKISYPVLQCGDDGAYYLTHNSEGAKDRNGALFTEPEYNSRDFTDPVSVIYGHHMRSGAMFGELQAIYSEEAALETYPDVLVYLPNGEQHYTVFAAVPFENDHILYYYDFSRETDYNDFLNRINGIRRIGASRKPEAEPVPGDQLLILSTCLSGNNQKRYLVLAKRTDDKP